MLGDSDSLARAVDIFSRAPFMMHLGVNVRAAGEGWVEAELSLTEWMQQQDGVAHAGIGTSLADHAMGTAAYTMMEPGYTPLSVEISIRLLRPVRGDRLRCVARVIKSGRRVSSVEADVWSETLDGSSTHVMRGNATMAVVASETL